MAQLSEQFSKDPTSDLAPNTHVHNAPRPMNASQLEPYQRIMVSEEGPRQLNALQQELDRHPKG